MSEHWFDGVGLAESPFAEAELPFAVEAWTPWAPAEALAEAWGEAEDAEGPGLGRLAADRLEWPGATADQLAFMRAVYAKHLERSKAKGDTFTADLPKDRLGPIEGDHQARRDAAAAARALLEEARAALAARAGRPGAHRDHQRLPVGEPAVRHLAGQGPQGRRRVPPLLRGDAAARPPPPRRLRSRGGVGDGRRAGQLDRRPRLQQPPGWAGHRLRHRAGRPGPGQD